MCHKCVSPRQEAEKVKAPQKARPPGTPAPKPSRPPAATWQGSQAGDPAGRTGSGQHRGEPSLLRVTARDNGKGTLNNSPQRVC